MIVALNQACCCFQVELCKECIQWAKDERRTFLRQALEVRLQTAQILYKHSDILICQEHAVIIWGEIRMVSKNIKRSVLRNAWQKPLRRNKFGRKRRRQWLFTELRCQGQYVNLSHWGQQFKSSQWHPGQSDIKWVPGSLWSWDRMSASVMLTTSPYHVPAGQGKYECYHRVSQWYDNATCFFFKFINFGGNLKVSQQQGK